MTENEQQFVDTYEALMQKASVINAIQSLWETGYDPFIGVMLDHPDFSVMPYKVFTGNAVPLFLTKRGISELRCDDADIEISMLSLNLSSNAINKYDIHEDGISFECRFNQVKHKVFVPYDAVLSIQDRSSNVGINCFIGAGRYKKLVELIGEKKIQPVSSTALGEIAKSVTEEASIAISEASESAKVISFAERINKLKVVK